MWWISRSENAFTVVLPSEGVICEGCVELIVGVWQVAQPMELKSDRPLEIDVEPPGVVVDGTGGGSMRIKSFKATPSLFFHPFLANLSELPLAQKFLQSPLRPVSPKSIRLATSAPTT